MKQTQTHVWSLAGEEAVSYSLARGKAAAVTRESGEVAAYSLARAVSCIGFTRLQSLTSVLQDFADIFSISLVFDMFFTLVLVEVKLNGI